MLFGTDNIVNLVLLLFSFLQIVLAVYVITTVTHIIWAQFTMNNAHYVLVYFSTLFPTQPHTFMQPSPSWETSNTPTGHEILCILQNLRVNHYCVHNTPQLVNNPSQIWREKTNKMQQIDVYYYCRMRAVLASYNAAPHNRYRPHPAEPEQHTKCSNRAFVLLKMGIMMPETCWDRR